MPTRVLTFVRSLLRLSLALALMLALPMLEWRGWDGQWRHGAAAWADDGDGGDGGGGADGEGGFTFPWREPSRPAARPTRPPPRRTQRAPKPPPPPADVVPNELLALNPAPAALGRATALGATEVETVAAGALGLRVVRLRLPAGLSVQNALAQLVTTDPGVFERHHRYTLQQAKAATPAADRCEGPACTMPGRLAGLIDWPADARQCGRGQVVGMVDTPVRASHPALAGAELRAEGFHDADRTAAPADHGTAVAALLVGRADDAFAGLLPRARLFAAAPFHQPAQGEPIADASALVKSLDWLAAQRVQVIGMSLAGPRNLVLNAAVQAVADKGIVVAAAAGNGGPNAAPAYPAAFERVLGVTAIDAKRQVYRRAQRGAHIDFALPGVEVWTAGLDGQGRRRSGTSYAVPFMVAFVSQSLAQRSIRRDELLQGRAGPVLDLGAPGHDPIFGWGQPRFEGKC